MKVARRLFYGALSAILVMLLALQGPVSAAGVLGEETGRSQHSDGSRCLSFTLPVASAKGQPRAWRVAGTYCQPKRWAKGGRQVDILTHGSTYKQSYWDWPQQPELYSYVQKTLASGRATLNYDRIGNGKSSRPASTEITMATDAYVLHQLVQGLKALGYNQINSISHSYGSGVALAEAAAYKDVSRIVLTGYLHRAGNPAVSAGNYPANQDPKFAGAGLDNGYMTSRPGVRGASFHSPSSDPAVVAYDEVQKDIVSLTGLLDFLSQRSAPAASNISNSIKVPVLVVNGEQDAIYCYDAAALDCTDTAAVKANEAPYFTKAKTFSVVMVPTSGHNLTLHPTANDSYAAINQWIKAN